MRRNTVLWTLLTLLLLAGPLLWLLFAPGEVPTLPPRAAVARAKAKRPAAPAESSRQRAALEAAPSPPASPGEPARVPPPKIVPPKRAEPRAILRIVLEGLDPDVPAADSLVEVWASRKVDPAISARRKAPEASDPDPRTVIVNGGSETTFEVDVTDVLGEDPSRDASVHVDRAHYLPATSLVRLVRSPSGSTQLRVRLAAAGWGVGRVEDDASRPLAGAEVSVFVARGDGWSFVDFAETGEDGRYRVRLVPGQVNLVVAAADGFLPSHGRLTGLVRVDAPVPLFVLRQGLAVTGTVRFADGAGASGSVFATPVGATPALATRTRRFAFVDGSLEECPAVGEASQGSFRVAGLLPGEDDVDVAIPCVSSALCLSVRQRVTPPFSGLSFVIDGGILDVVVTKGGRPLAEALLVLSNESDSANVRTDADGRARLVGFPARTYLLRVLSEDGSSSAGVKVVAPPAGSSQRVDVRL